MARLSTHAAAYALCAALSGCSTEAASPAKKQEPAPPVFDEQRPTGGLVEPQNRGPEFHRGISLQMFGASQEEGERRPKYVQFLDDARELGATDLELVVAWWQADNEAIEVTPHPSEGVDDDLLTWVMDEAQARNLRVLLTPIIDLENKAEDSSRTALKPSDSNHWWWSYRRFVMHYARIASAHKASLFSVGNQLLSTEADEQHWRALITDVRKAYSGKLTYTAHASRFESIAFWDAVDVVSIGGVLGSLQRSAKDAHSQHTCSGAARLRSWSEETGRGYLLVGALCEDAARDGKVVAARAEGQAPRPGTRDRFKRLIEQRALFTSFQGEPRLSGVFVPQSFTLHESLDQAPTLRGKLATNVLKHWFTRSRSVAASAILP